MLNIGSKVYHWSIMLWCLSANSCLWEFIYKIYFHDIILHLFKKWFMLRYSDFNVLNLKAWNLDPSNSVFVCEQWVEMGWVRGGHSVHPLSAVGVEPPTKFSKRGGLTRPQLLEGGCWERGWLFSGGLQFSHKNKIKSEIF